jgi:phenylalanyl-tRNA synthetase beta chain
MPTIEVEREDLELLLGLHLPTDLEELNDVFSFIKGEVKYADEKEIHIDIKDSNRADIWGVEGIARALRGILGVERGLKLYKLSGEPGVNVLVDQRLKNIRPYIACAVVKGVRLSDAAIRHIMRFQDKMDQTYGRSRRRTSIGLYDFDLITPPLRYTVSKPDEIRFVPLGFNEELTLKEILKVHPKGLMYGHIVEPYNVWPILIESKDKVLSFPPIINSNDLGRLTVKTRNVLVEVTGTVYSTVLYTLTNMILALADRGGEICPVEIHYPYGDLGCVRTPNLENERMELNVQYVRKIIGMHLSLREIVDLLERSRYGISKIMNEDTIVVEIPCYRPDIMHPIDIVEDIAIAYDLNKMQPRWPQISTVGGLHRESSLRNLVREIMVGLGYQEVLTFTLSNPETLFEKMNIPREKVVELANPKVSSMTCLRNWLLPNLMEFLSRNTHVEYPQRIFEVGYCVVHDEKQINKTRDIEKLACVTIHSSACFSEAKSVIDALFNNLELEYDLEETSSGSFIEGRVGKIIIEREEVGLIGEIHPEVLQNWNLENPAAAFEIDLSKIWLYIENR